MPTTKSAPRKAKAPPLSEEYYRAGGLKGERGWTDALIRKLVSPPDATRPNPHYQRAAPWKLYLIGRVEAIERSAEFRAAAARAETRRRVAEAAQRRLAEAGAARLAEDRRLRLERVEQLRVDVPVLERDELIRRACEHYNAHRAARAERTGDDDYLEVMPDSSPDFLDRIAVNYLRHCLTGYDAYLADAAYDHQARLAVARKVFAAIGEAYPDLERECARKLAEWETARWG